MRGEVKSNLKVKSKLKSRTVNPKLVVGMGGAHCCSDQEPHRLPTLSRCRSFIRLTPSMGATSCEMVSYQNATIFRQREMKRQHVCSSGLALQQRGKEISAKNL